MNPFEKNRQSFRKSVERNTDRTIKESYSNKNFAEIKSNFPDSNKKSKFDMTDKYYKTHMKEK